MARQQTDTTILTDENRHKDGEGITWISPQSLIKLRGQARSLPLDRNKIRAKQGGAYLSTFKGRGMEFDESRIYQPGDDIRNMDWRVTARTGNPHTKIFQEERERPVLLWLDLGNSMMFATRQCYKAVIAAQCAATIAWSAAGNNDRVGGLIFSGDQHNEIKPGRGKSAVLRLIGQISRNPAWEDAGADTTASKENAIARLRSVAHPGSLIFMISDFRHMSEKAFSHLANLSRHNDIVLLRITDPFEHRLPDAGLVRFTDGMDDYQMDTHNTSSRENYHQQSVVAEEQLARFCRKHAIHLVQLSTSDDIFMRLRETFAPDRSASSTRASHGRKGAMSRGGSR